MADFSNNSFISLYDVHVFKSFLLLASAVLTSWALSLPPISTAYVSAAEGRLMKKQQFHDSLAISSQ